MTGTKNAQFPDLNYGFMSNSNKDILQIFSMHLISDDLTKMGKHFLTLPIKNIPIKRMQAHT